MNDIKFTDKSHLKTKNTFELIELRITSFAEYNEWLNQWLSKRYFWNFHNINLPLPSWE